ncbi:MAG: InlB B-repeat-containing protein [Treponema sp.]|jgi:uncharacterized repeat protein (TIGR02543 family)|nr:InlB B-repeat-containing protein [Treponema sp.]
MKNKRVFFKVLLMALVGLGMLGITGCDNGSTSDSDPTQQYTVTFNANEGLFSDTNTATKTEKVEKGKTLSSLPTPTKTSGDTSFQGWYTSKDGETPFTLATPITADITVYAKWGGSTPTKYTVKFDLDGGAGAPDSILVNAGDPVGDLPTPTKNGTVFEGWVNKSGGGKIAATTVVNGNMEVYAKWAAIIYGCAYSQKTETHTDSNGNKSTQYLLSITYKEALPLITAELGNPAGDQGSLFWGNSELAADNSWVILEYNEFYTEGSASSTNQVRLIEKGTNGITGKRWSL